MTIKVLFAPDYTADNSYQRLLAEALKREGIEVELLNFNKRGLPLSRAMKVVAPDLLHLHWPEAYFRPQKDGLDLARILRYPLDFRLAKRNGPVVYTAHNLTPHNTASSLVRRNMKATVQMADAVIAHSAACRHVLINQYAASRETCHVIPHGDQSAELGQPLSRQTARRLLGLGDEAVCLVFGVISPYKGIHEIVEWWGQHKGMGRLEVVGPVFNEAYGAELLRHADGLSNVSIRCGRVSGAELKAWMCAADCALFNYKQIFTSGAACLARSFGVPILLPARLSTVDLDEPSPLVARFDRFDELPERIGLFEDVASGWKAAADWRRKTSWESVANATADRYREVLRGR